MMFLGRLRLSTNYPGTTSTRDLYLKDLNALRIATGVDDRPLNGTVTLGTTAQLSDVTNSLTSSLGLSTASSNASTSAPLTRPGTVTTYQLYPGVRCTRYLRSLPPMDLRQTTSL